MSLNCPVCQQPLAQPESGQPCEHCGTRFHLVACCPQCHQPLDVLKACGAVNYFCQHGHGLISRKTIAWQALAD